jgi:hypothetical protein
MVMGKIDSNAILVEPMKSCKDAEMIQAYDALLHQLKQAGIVLKKHVLDNKVSENMKNHIRDTHKFDMELVPPGCHCRNAAEVAIRNFKAHFLSKLAGLSDDFPPSYGTSYSHKPKSQSTSFNNLMPPQMCQHTRISVAHSTTTKCRLPQWDATHRYMRKLTNKCTWAYHSVDRWYLFTSPEHYRTHNCHIKHTKSKRLSNTMQFQHKPITNPSITHTNKVMHALAYCVKAMQGMTGKDRHSPATKNLQQIVDATQAQIKAQPDRFEHTAANTPPVQRVPRVQMAASMPTPHTDANRRIMRSMNMMMPFPRGAINNVPTEKINCPTN